MCNSVNELHAAIGEKSTLSRLKDRNFKLNSVLSCVGIVSHPRVTSKEVNPLRAKMAEVTSGGTN